MEKTLGGAYQEKKKYTYNLCVGVQSKLLWPGDPKPCGWNEIEVYFSQIEQFQGKRVGTQDYPGIQASQLALSLSLIPGDQEGGKKSRASVLSYMSRQLASHWPKLSHVATAHFKRGQETWAPTRQPCPQLKRGVEREVVLLLKERESDSWGQCSSLHLSGNPTSQTGTPPHTLYSVHSFNRLYFPRGLP